VSVSAIVPRMDLEMGQPATARKVNSSLLTRTVSSGPVQRRIGEDVGDLDESSPIVHFTHRVWISLAWMRALTMDGNVRLLGWDCGEEGISLWRSWVLHRTD